MMMLKRRPNRRELYERILGIDKAKRGAAARIEKSLAILYRDYFARVKEMVSDPKLLKTGEKVTAESTIAMMNQLTPILVEAGFEDVIGEYVDQFHGLTKEALDYWTAFGAKPSLANVNTDSLNSWIRFSEGELRNMVPAKVVSPIQTALMQVNFAGASRDAVYEQVGLLEESLSPVQVVTLVNDAFSGYQRATLIETADSVDLDIFIYLGPDDAITSDECEEMLHVDMHGVEGMLYKDEITPALHWKLAKYGRNPLIGGGHPNCRHVWSPVTADYAADQGFELRRAAA